jgi:hypothetical protein
MRQALRLALRREEDRSIPINFVKDLRECPRSSICIDQARKLECSALLRDAIKDEIDLINTHHDQQTTTNKVASVHDEFIY